MSWANHFLDALNAADRRALRPHITPVNLARNDRLDDVGQPIRFIYLPVEAILSVVTVMRSGAQVESRTIGRESGYGLLHALGSPISFERMFVQVGGAAWRLPMKEIGRAHV